MVSRLLVIRLKVANLNTGNTAVPGSSDGTYADSRPGHASDTDAPELGGKEVLYNREEEENFRRNREDSLKLCDAFQAFYGTHAAYHLDL